MAATAVQTPAVIQARLGEIVTRRQKWLLLLSLALCMFMTSLDNSITSTATPRIVSELGHFHLLAWLFTGYLLASTVCIPVFGKLSDMFGRRGLLVVGLGIFTASSAACGLAPSMFTLILARVAQGIGGGITAACVFGTLGDLLTPIERAKYFALFAGTGTVAQLLGPTFGGFITDGPGWRWCFFVNVPICGLAATAILMNLPNRRSGGHIGDIDFLGAALLGGGTVSLLLGLVWGHEAYGWSGPITLGLFGGAAVLIPLFVLQERRHPHAILPLHLFGNRVFVLCNGISALIMFASSAGTQYLPTFIQTSLGASATASGVVTTPQSLALLGAGIVGGQVMARTGRYKLMLIVGSSFLIAAAFMLSRLDVGVTKWHISAFMILFGIGSGLVVPPLAVIVQSCVQPDQMGVASGSRIFFMQIGTVVGGAVFGVVLATSYESAFDHELTRKADLPPAAYAELQDPTLPLNKTEFAVVREQVLAVPDGQAVLDDALRAQREAVATGIRNVFLGVMGAAMLLVVLAIAMSEITLRRSFKESPERAGGGEPLDLPEVAL